MSSRKRRRPPESGSAKGYKSDELESPYAWIGQSIRVMNQSIRKFEYGVVNGYNERTLRYYVEFSNGEVCFILILISL